MSDSEPFTHLMANALDDNFLEVVERLHREGDAIGQASGRRRAGGARTARRAAEAPADHGAALPGLSEQVRFEELIETLRGQLDLPRPAAVAQALRNAELRTAFISEIGALTAAEVAQLAGSRAKNSSALAGRWRAERRVFAVPWAGEMLYPAFQFMNGGPRPAIARALETFGERVSGWEIALWFATPSPYLPHDARPVDMLDDPGALVDAARREQRLPEF